MRRGSRREQGIQRGYVTRLEAKVWRMDVSGARRLKLMEDKNRRLRPLVAGLSLDAEGRNLKRRVALGGIRGDIASSQPSDGWSINTREYVTLLTDNNMTAQQVPERGCLLQLG
jgi:hypothetical protein